MHREDCEENCQGCRPRSLAEIYFGETDFVLVRFISCPFSKTGAVGSDECLVFFYQILPEYDFTQQDIVTFKVGCTSRNKEISDIDNTHILLHIFFFGCDNIFVFQIKLITVINDATISTYTVIAFHAGLQYMRRSSPSLLNLILLCIKK